MSTQKEYPEEVQLRLRMTSEQINDTRVADRSHAANMGHGENKRVTRLFNTEAARPWADVLRSKPPYDPKGPTHYRYHADLARGIADKKEDRNARRYWNRQAARFDVRGR